MDWRCFNLGVAWLILFLAFPIEGFSKQKDEFVLVPLPGNYVKLINEENLELPLRVRLEDKLGNPISGAIVEFQVMQDHFQNLDISFEPLTSFTDSLGYCETSVIYNGKAQRLKIAAIASVEGNPGIQVFEYDIKRRGWLILLIIGIGGGLAIFLLGMKFMSDGLQNSAGNKMKSILGSLTDNRLKGAAVGAFITMVIQSSSATNVMLVGFVNSKLMRLRQTLGVMLGASIGTTITAQIIAFKITDWALLFVFLGLLVQSFTKIDQVKEIGRTILGFGLLFFGMYIMSDAVYPLRSDPTFLSVLTKMEVPIMGVLIGAVFTAIIQSSSAFIGILIILSLQGLLSVHAVVPLLIGANVGTAITAVLASIGTNREARQVALVHTLFKVLGAAAALIFIGQALEFLASKNGDIASARLIANVHTVFNVGLCAVFLPFTNLFARLVEKIYPVHDEEAHELHTLYLDKSISKGSAIALDMARLELVRMMSIVKEMSSKIIEPFMDKKCDYHTYIDNNESLVNFLRDEIIEFLLEIAQTDTSKSTVEESFVLMNAIREFEQIADTVSGAFKSKADSWCASSYEFSVQGKEELLQYHASTISLLNNAIKVHKSFDLKKAAKMKRKYDTYREQFLEFEKSHFKRLRNNVEDSISSSKTHLEIITLLKIMSHHAMNTARIIIRQSQPKK